MSGLSAAVVGGGLVGALESCLLARRGFNVTLFEARHDGRNEPTYYGRSINLAISHRGISALERVGLDYIVKTSAIPMKARMIHDRSGRMTPIPYDPDGRCINSIERAALNNFLLDKAEKEYGVKILFNHKMVDMSAENGEIMFRLRDERASDTGEAHPSLLSYKFDLILGCDGARSSVRSLLARQSELELSQTYIEHGYLELRIDPLADGQYRMPHNYLHIWPRGQYMMIALPNKDASFTCTLFMPFNILATLKEPATGLAFFKENFPDAVELIGEERIRKTLADVRASSLISIKCRPYNFKGKLALLGDAAHAMVPFYGQGMNCGFEDCLVLDELLDKYLPTMDCLQNMHHSEVEQLFAKILGEYNDMRCNNGHSMCDLAMYNYMEMRDLVNTMSFRLRKHWDNLMYRLFPQKWIPLYTMVTFSRIPVDECIRRREAQDKFLRSVLAATCVSLALSSGFMLMRSRFGSII